VQVIPINEHLNFDGTMRMPLDVIVEGEDPIAVSKLRCSLIGMTCTRGSSCEASQPPIDLGRPMSSWP